MKNPFPVAGLAGLALLATATAVPAMDFNGHWHGQGSAITGDCGSFEIFVLVQDQKLFGKAFKDDDDYSISGSVSQDGQLRGEVTYLTVAIAELSGDLAGGRGVGTWSTFKGPACEGKFAVEYVPDADGIEAQLANRRSSSWTEKFTWD